jgi:beta-lactamase class A
VALLAEAGNPSTAVAHLGAGFPVSPTSAVAYVLGDTWLEVAWQTPGRTGMAWLPESSLAFGAPAGVANASLDALDPDLWSYLTALGVRAGVEVYDLTRATVYTYNATHQYTTASSVKVPIMLAFLAQVEAEGREPTAHEKTLLTEMIEKSMDYAATALWAEIGGAAGLSGFMRRIGVEGLSPYQGGWSWSTMSPEAMVRLLTKLHEGTILQPEHRELALYLMSHVIASQRIGVADTAPPGASVAMKIGRWWYDERHGGTVMSSSGIVTLGSETYVISVYTDHNPSMTQAEATVRHVCSAIASLLLNGVA